MIYESNQNCYSPGICSIDDLHISISNAEELSLARPLEENIGDESSVNTEICLNALMAKDKREKQKDPWDPNDSDYSLGVRLQEMSEQEMSFERSESSKSLASTQTDISSSSVASSSYKEEEDSEVSPLCARPSSKVSFNTRVKLVRVPLLDTLSAEEIGATWYSSDELQEMRDGLVDILRIMLDKDRLLPSCKKLDDLCFRGLEYKAGPCSKARTNRKAVVRNNIMNEQDFQREMNIVNPDDIAEISRKLSAPSVQTAIEIAERDSSMDYNQWRLFYEEGAFLHENEPPSPRSRRGLWRKGVALSTKLRYYKELRKKERAMAMK